MSSHSPFNRCVYIWCPTVSKILNVYSQKWNCAASSPNFYIHVSGSYLFFPQSVLPGISIFLYCVRELSAQPQEQRGGQGTAGKQGLAAVPCPSLHSCGWARVHINYQHTNFQCGKLRIINGNKESLQSIFNFLIWFESEWDSIYEFYIGFLPALHLQYSKLCPGIMSSHVIKLSLDFNNPWLFYTLYNYNIP